MPLNIQDPDQEKSPEPRPAGATPAPPTQAPSGSNRNLLLWIFAAVVLASAVFLVLQFGLLPHTGGKPAPADAGAKAVPGATGTSAGAEQGNPPGGAEGPQSSSEPAKKVDATKGATDATTAAGTKGAGESKRTDDVRAAELRQRLARAEGDYAIFISAFSAQADAEELSGRWGRAGYPAFVQHSGRWYRVGIGRFPTIADARQEAEKLRQAFEDGYWIGRAGPE